ncbi:MAG: flagellin [Phycisphaerales bacterium]
MSRINTNASSMIAQANLSKNNKQLNTTLERLSTGLRINRGADDPAGLIASENLRSEKTALSAAISNAERADQISNIAEGGLQEVSNLLTDLKGLVTATANGAGLSTEEKQANQLQIDSILQTIDRISDSTNFQGVKLLNGNLDFTTSSVSTNVSDFRVNAAKLNQGSTMGVVANVTTSAQRGAALLDFNAAGIVTTSAGKLFTIEVQGSKGSREFSFNNGTTMAQAVTAINSFKDVLGISAAANSTSGLDLRSTEFGSDQFVAIKVVEDAGVAGANIVQGGATAAYTYTGTSTAVADGASVRDTGQDVGGTINGVLATGKGRTLAIASDFLDTSITLAAGTAGAAGSTNAFTVTGGGASFQLSSKVNIGGKTTLGVQSVATRKLGRTEVTSTSGTANYYLSDLASGKHSNVVTGNLTDAGGIVDEAIRQVSSLRGRLGAFQKNTIGSTINSLNVSLENSAAAESVIRDADFATETAALTRGQILAQAAGNSLSLSNSQPQQALSLLRG